VAWISYVMITVLPSSASPHRQWRLWLTSQPRLLRVKTVVSACPLAGETVTLPHRGGTFTRSITCRSEKQKTSRLIQVDAVPHCHNS
jgi:hypothetical protein